MRKQGTTKWLLAADFDGHCFHRAKPVTERNRRFHEGTWRMETLVTERNRRFHEDTWRMETLVTEGNRRFREGTWRMDILDITETRRYHATVIHRIESKQRNRAMRSTKQRVQKRY